MSSGQEQLRDDYDEWKARFHALSRVQARALYLLFVFGVFYWTLPRPTQSATQPQSNTNAVPLIGLPVDTSLLQQTGPLVLAFIMLIALGTFPALRTARDRLGTRALSDSDFERLDVMPTPLDLITYLRIPDSRFKRLGLLAYPTFFTLFCAEAWYLGLNIGKHGTSSLSLTVLVSLGVVCLILCSLRILQLWRSKVGELFRALPEAQRSA